MKEAFEIYPDIYVTPGTYDNVEAAIVFYTNRGAPVAFNMRTIVGGFFGGDRLVADADPALPHRRHL